MANTNTCKGYSKYCCRFSAVFFSQEAKCAKDLPVLADACRSVHGSGRWLRPRADSDARPHRGRLVRRQIGRIRRQDELTAAAGRVLSRVQPRQSASVGRRRRMDLRRDLQGTRAAHLRRLHRRTEKDQTSGQFYFFAAFNTSRCICHGFSDCERSSTLLGWLNLASSTLVLRLRTFVSCQ